MVEEVNEKRKLELKETIRTLEAQQSDIEILVAKSELKIAQ